MITEIEQAVAARLRQGLGKLVREVKSYGGELDNESWANAIKQVPACWVTYGGAKIEARSTSRKQYRQTAVLVVMAATRSLRSELSGRQGGTDIREVGSNALVYAVLRLLAGQRLDEKLDSYGLVPKKTRTVLNNAVVQNAALSVVAVEFEASWDFEGLENGRFPEKTDDPQNPDHIFTKYQGSLSAADPDFITMGSRVFDPPSGAEVESVLTVGNHGEQQT